MLLITIEAATLPPDLIKSQTVVMKPQRSICGSWKLPMTGIQRLAVGVSEPLRGWNLVVRSYGLGLRTSRERFRALGCRIWANKGLGFRFWGVSTQGS